MLHILKKKKEGQEVLLSIKGMHCTSCAMNIDGALEDTKGVYSSETSYAKAQVKVNFDPKQLSVDQLRNVISEQGYEVGE